MIPAEPSSEPGAHASQRVLKSDADPYRSVFEVNPVPMLICEVGTLQVVAANAAAAKLHGMTVERLHRATLFELRQVSDLTRVMLKRAAGHEIGLGFGYHRRDDGTTFPVELTVHPSELGGNPVWVCVLKSLEALLAPQESEPHRRLLEAVGRVSAGAAHDINNQLSIILSLSDLLTPSLAGSATAQAHLAELRGAAERAGQLAKQLLRLSRKGPIAPQPLRLNEVVLRLEKLLRRALDDDTELVIELAAEVDPALADAAQVERLLVQVVAAAPSGGRGRSLRIETRNVELDTEHGRESHVELRVTDSIGELTPEAAAWCACVDPGLAWLETEAGVGSAVVACFPSAKGESNRTEGRPPKARSETVLVVQDNVHLRKTLRTYFGREGFRVLDADSGLQALRLVESGVVVDLLVTDFVLTDAAGRDLSRTLRERMPSLRVLFAVGDSEQGDALQLDERTATINKPFDLGQFGALVERLLREPNLS